MAKTDNAPTIHQAKASIRLFRHLGVDVFGEDGLIGLKITSADKKAAKARASDNDWFDAQDEDGQKQILVAWVKQAALARFFTTELELSEGDVRKANSFASKETEEKQQGKRPKKKKLSDKKRKAVLAKYYDLLGMESDEPESDGDDDLDLDLDLDDDGDDDEGDEPEEEEEEKPRAQSGAPRGRPAKELVKHAAMLRKNLTPNQVKQLIVQLQKAS